MGKKNMAHKQFVQYCDHWKKARVSTMAIKICSLLDLSPKAGLGGRLCEVVVEEDMLQSGIYYLIGHDAFEIQTLALALNALVDALKAKLNMNFDMRFIAHVCA